MEKDQVWKKNDMPLVPCPSECMLGKKPGRDRQKGREQTSSTYLGPLGTQESALQGEASGEYCRMLPRARQW